MAHEPFSRRQVLQTAAAGSALAIGAGAAVGYTPDERVTSDDFEAREWGFVRSDYDPPDREDVPVVFGMEGYEGAGDPTHYLRMRDDTLIGVNLEGPSHRGNPNLSANYLQVSASIRGTGCSGGTFDLFDRVHARDGREIIEWLADRPWSLDRVGLYGASYSGITALLVASAQPPSLGAVSANLVIGDLYRGIAYPGGVPNSGFPGLWNGIFRPQGDVAGTSQGVQAGDEICAQNVALREPGHPADEPTTAMYTRREDDTMYQVRSPITYADRIEAPIYIAQAWQDEQTGPRGGTTMFNAVDPDPASPPGTQGKNRPPLHESPKLFRTVNGVHNTGGSMAADDAQAWFDYWLLGEDTGIMDEPQVELRIGRGADEATHGSLGLDSFPIRDGDVWERYYFDDGDLTPSAPTEAGTEAYLSGSPRQSWVWSTDGTGPITDSDGPDMLTYRGEAVTSPTMLAGPMCATLFIESTAADTDLFVTVLDEAPDGTMTPLQRGLLRGSHRMLDETESWYTDDGELIRPYRAHRNTTPLTPGEITRFDVEVFPVGHLLYPEHRLVVTVSSPPVADGLWGYEPLSQPGVNTLHQSPDHPSSIIVPLVDWEGDVPEKPGCGAPDGYRCVETLQ